MRILLVTNYQPPHMGGIEFAGEALKACWERDGHTVTWLSTDIPAGARPESPDNLRVRAANFAERWWQINTPFVSPLELTRIRRAVAAHDVVNTHSLAPGLSTLAMRAAVSLRKPLVVTQHVAVIDLKSRALSALQHAVVTRNARYAARHGAPVTFVGEAVRAWFQQHAGLRDDQVAMTPAGIDPSAYHFVDDAERSRLRATWQLSDTAMNVLFVGRFYDKKGLPLLREVAAQLPHIHFTLVGSGPINPASWALPNIRIVGFVSSADLRALYGAHDLFVMPSYGECWPAVVPQAMACGTPCLVSEECFTGYGRDADRFLVTPRTTDAVAAILERAARGEEPLRQRRRYLAQYATEIWSWQRTARRYVELFQQRISAAAG